MKSTVIAIGVGTLLSIAAAACGKNNGQAATDRPMDKTESEMKTPIDATAVDTAHGFGTVKSIDQDARKVMLSHDPIPEIGWGAMTMGFAVAKQIDVASLNAGDKLHFILEPAGDGTYTVAMACRIEGEMGAHKSMMKSMEDMRGDMMEGMDMQGRVMPCMLDPR